MTRDHRGSLALRCTALHLLLPAGLSRRIYVLAHPHRLADLLRRPVLLRVALDHQGSTGRARSRSTVQSPRARGQDPPPPPRREVADRDHRRPARHPPLDGAAGPRSGRRPGRSPEATLDRGSLHPVHPGNTQALPDSHRESARRNGPGAGLPRAPGPLPHGRPGEPSCRWARSLGCGRVSVPDPRGYSRSPGTDAASGRRHRAFPAESSWETPRVSSRGTPQGELRGP